MPSFDKDAAMRLISKMRINYGKKFTDQWAGVEVDELAQEMVDQYQDLSFEDFQRGLAKMRQHAWPPTVPEFRLWCKPESKEWLGAHEAWAIAEKSVDAEGRELTVIWTEQIAQAFRRCEGLVRTNDKYQRIEARRIFCDVYERLIAQAKDQGLKPVYITSLGVDKDQAIAAIQQAEFEGFLAPSVVQEQLEYKQTKAEIKAESERYKTIAQEALLKLGKIIKRDSVNKIPKDSRVGGGVGKL